MKHDVQNSNTASTLPNIVNSNVERDVNLTLFNVLNFNVDIHNAVSTLTWHCPTSQRYITLTTTLRQRWNVCWVLKNVAKRLHNFVKLIKLKSYIFCRIPFTCRHKIKKENRKRAEIEKHCLNNGNVREKWAKTTQ